MADKMLEHPEMKTDGAEVEIDHEAESRLLRKLDRHICPVLFVIYFLAFLDRANIGNAKIQGMTEELQLDVQSRFNIALFIFFVPYIILDLPSNMLLNRMRPSIFISSLVFAWGVINMCMGFVRSFAGLAVLRAIMGIFEAGLYPAISYLVSIFYSRHELQTRLAFIFCSVQLSGAFSGLLAYAISHLDGHMGYAGWRWIFIIEGSVTAATGLLTVFLIADFPEQARFLTPAEKHLLSQRLQRDNGGVKADDMSNLNWRQAVVILKDWKIWVAGGMNFSTICSAYSVSFFLPTILEELGWKATDAQLHTIPVHLEGLVFVILLAWGSDRLRHRFAFIVVPTLLGAVGLAMLLGQQNLSTGARYGATFLVEFNSFTSPLILAWLLNNLRGHAERAVGSATAIMLGNCAGPVASNIFLAREKPTYTTGYAVLIGTTMFGVLCACIMEVGLFMGNRRMHRKEKDGQSTSPPNQLATSGDDHGSFRYTL